jgi:XRE family aerobic/anaerobic benzoate catabolism transcriptional regulator
VKRFRELEAEALEDVLREEGERIVLATSGSIIDSPQTWARLRATCRTVWLRAEPEEHMRRVMEQGDRRPMRDRPRAMDELRGLLKSRQGRYEECDRVVETGTDNSARLVAELSSWVSGG